MAYKFRLLRGRHAQNEVNKEGAVVVKCYEATHGKNIIVSETDLAAKFNKPGSIKFEPIGPSAPTPITRDVRKKVLASATIEELREMLKAKQMENAEEDPAEFNESSFVENPEEFETKAQEIEDSEEDEEYQSKELEDMTRSELEEYANDYGIDIAGLTRKKDILERIRSAVEPTDEKSDEDGEE